MIHPVDRHIEKGHLAQGGLFITDRSGVTPVQGEIGYFSPPPNGIADAGLCRAGVPAYRPGGFRS